MSPSNEFSLEFEHLQTFVTSLFPDGFTEDYQPQVSVTDQQEEVGLIKNTMLSNDRFFIVVDLLQFEITELHGIKKWLGYSERDFTLKQYWDKVVPLSSKASLIIIAKEMYRRLCTGMYELDFMVQRYSIAVPLKHYNGHHILVKKTASIFQYDQQNRLTGYIDEFTIINHEYNGEPLSPVFYNINGEIEIARGKEIMMEVLTQFLKMKIFSPKELQTIRLLVNNNAITQQEIATLLHTSVHSVKTYFKRFLQKARDFYQRDFASAVEAGNHLKREGLL